ncbi:MAG: glycosyltransferase [Candidatus Dadabacteria bacterium]|nr:MAG: glycosyltransferase [Candidatus Dadabacteria bacterium]
MPYIVDFRDPWPDSFAGYLPKVLWPALCPLASYYRWIIRFAANNASGITSISETMLKWALSYKTKSLNAPHKAFPIGYKSPLKTEEPIVQDVTETAPITAVFVGLFGSTHGGEKIIEAFNILWEKGEKRAKCLMVGDGNFAALWREKAKGNPNIEFLGWADKQKLREIMSRCHVGLIVLNDAIRKFWFGNKLFEYLASGLAVVAYASPEVSFLLEENSAGTAIHNGTSEELAGAIERYIENPVLLTLHRKNALDLFKREFVSDAIYTKFAEFIEGIVP